ncbi:MAG: RNA polymerase factor sigma-54 [Bacteroides sp.]
MAQSSRQIQAQTQKQTQTLSPQQILVVKLLELPTLEFEERVHAELLENPALEEDKELTAEEEEYQAEKEESTDYDSLDDYLSEDDIPDYKLKEHNFNNESQPENIPISDTTSFYDILLEQLGEQKLTDTQELIGRYLIGSLDDDGLLRKTTESINDELAIYMGIDTSPDEIETVLRVIQDFEPAGVGARDLQECLLIQIKRKPDTPTRSLEWDIISSCYEEFTRKHWDKITQKLNISEDLLNKAMDEIIKLNPRPGASLGESIGKNLQQIIPDFIVETFDGTISLSLNNKNVPELKLNREFTTMIEEHTKNKDNQTKEAKEAMLFLKQKLDSAQGFIDAIVQRQHTLISTMQAIINLQRPFFLDGDESKLKPMILKDVADITGLDISTISRVTNSKYVQTNFGIFSLKYFFGDSFTTEDGEEMSIREVKRILLECINKEDKKSPLTDEQLARLLKDKGYPIARRTVAKYRQQLNIPVARLRR